MLSSQSSVSRKRQVLWSPHHTNLFTVGSNDLRLYELKYKNNNIVNNNANNDIAFDIEYPTDDWVFEDKKTIELKSVNSDVQYFKCMTWSPDPTDPNLIACGLVNGKVVLTSFSSINRIVKEFVPKHTRPCNTVAWNPVNKTHIAVGLDKVRGDSSTLVWDINYLSKPKLSNSSSIPSNLNTFIGAPASGTIDAPYPISQISENSFSTTPLEQVETITQPISEFSISESTMSLAWIPSNPFCLLIGTGSKYLRIYDTRDTKTSQSIVAHQKAVNGVVLDPFDNNRLATMSEDGVVKIWDMRRIQDESIFTINTGYKCVQQIDWCPTRSGILATSGKEKNTIKLWDIKSFTSSSEYHNSSKSPRPDRKSISDQSIHSISKPFKSHISSEIISSFSWHPTNECRMLTVSLTGIVEVISLNETIPLSWSPHGSLSFSFGKYFIQGPSNNQTIEPNLDKIKLNNDGRYNKDISHLMRERSIQGYSGIVDDNVNLTNNFNDKEIQFLWNWIQKIPSYLQNFIKKPTPKIDSKENDYIGIQQILSDNQHITFETINGFQIYKSLQRHMCGMICGWGFSPSNQLESTILKLEKAQEFERAAALAIFHLEIKRAITVLSSGCSLLQVQQQQQIMINNPMQLNQIREREFQLRVLSMALAGFGDQQLGSGSSNNIIWRETCKSTAKSFSNPYLRLSLEFLSTNGSSVESIKELIGYLVESKVSLVDKIAFACRFFDQPDLLPFIDRQINACIESGDLMGIFLTGLTPKGMDLLQHYVDRTSDVQTVALTSCLVVPKIFRDHRATRWLSVYSDLLDTWGSWHQRAMLDIQRTSGSEPPPSQIFARCGYCQGSFSFESVTSGSMVGRNVKINARAKVPCCPHCKQSLPRCCLCMMQMSCMVPGMDFKKSNKTASSGEFWTEGAESFDDWFTWCQTCRHGGHASHLSDWFQDHNQCPVTDCNCKCSSL